MKPMSMAEYKYQPTTHAELRTCIKWCQNQFQLRDWEVKLDTSLNMPKEFKPGNDDDYEALANISRDRLRAMLWIPIAKLAESDSNPIEATVHEMCHIMSEARGVEGDDEGLVRTISPLAYRLYCRDKNIKRASKK